MKEEKTAISRAIVAAIRETNGRFLERAKDKCWYDIGDPKATEKTSQALREGQPELRQKMIDSGMIKDFSMSPPGSIEMMLPPNTMATSVMPINNKTTLVGSDTSSNENYMRMMNNQYPSLGTSLDRLVPGRDTILHSNQQQIYGQSEPADYLAVPRERRLDHRKAATFSPPIHQKHNNNDNYQSHHFSRGEEKEKEKVEDIDDLDDNHSIMTFEMDIDEIIDIDSLAFLPPSSSSSPLANHLRALKEFESIEPIKIDKYHVIESSFSGHRNGNHYNRYSENRQFDRNLPRVSDDLELLADDDSGCISLEFVSSMVLPTQANSLHTRHTI